MIIKRISLFVFITLLAILAGLPSLALAQDESLKLSINKIFGYGGFGGREFQGVMNLSAQGPENLQRVVFFIDGQTMGEDTQAPFELHFDTGSYGLGQHQLTATGYTNDGSQLQSNTITTQFVTAQRGMQRGLSFIIPLLIVIFAAMLLSVVVPMLFNKGKKLETPLGQERHYSASGGTICPRCKRPFPLHFLAFNFGPGMKMERCPYCGRIGLFRRYSLSDLRTAEAAERSLAGPTEGIPALTEEEKLRKELEESRYHDA